MSTAALVLFLTAAWAGGPFAPVARGAYFAVYITAAAVCLAAGRALRGHGVRWLWLAPAIASIPVAIVAQRWSVTISDVIALSFYFFAILSAVGGPSRRCTRFGVARQSLDLLLTVTAIITVTLYIRHLGIFESAWLRELSVYRLLAPGAAALLVMPALVQTAPRGHWREDPGVYLLLGGIFIAVLTDITPASVDISPFTWACAVWLMSAGAYAASVRQNRRLSASPDTASLPTGWWPTAIVSSVYALLAVQLAAISSPAIRLLATGGTILTALVLVRQIVALRENEQLLEWVRSHEARVRALVKYSTDAFLVIGPMGRIAYHSPALASFARLPDEDYTGLTISAVLAPQDKSALNAMLADVGQQLGRSCQTKLSFKTLGAGARELEVIATNRCNDPAIGGIVVNIRDITERTQLERQLAHRDRMEAVGRLTSGVAHEFNNLLTVIMGHVDMLAGRVHPERGRPDELDEIREAAIRAAELTRSLLGVSRTSSGEQAEVDLRALLRRVERMVCSGLGPEYEMVVQAAPDLWAARVDAQDLQHALLNLALNARDAMPHGGLLTIRTENMPAAELPPGTPMPARDYVRISVQDTGAGMTADVLAQAFEPFFTTKPEGQGTGLGLAIAHAAVHRNGGFINVHSTPGGGTTFTLWLPRA